MKSMLRMVVSAAFVASAPALAEAQGIQQVTPNYRVVQRGQTVKIGGYGSYDPDCRSLGVATINLTSAPQGGQVYAEPGRDFPSFSNTNVRFRCNRLRLPATVLSYRASRNFVGIDTFNIEAVFANGEARQYRMTVYVR